VLLPVSFNLILPAAVQGYLRPCAGAGAGAECQVCWRWLSGGVWVGQPGHHLVSRALLVVLATGRVLMAVTARFRARCQLLPAASTASPFRGSGGRVAGDAADAPGAG